MTNGFSSVHCACTILKKQGAEVPMSLPLPTKLGTCGKDIDQGRLIYVPAMVFNC